MRYRISGRDQVSGQAIESFFVEAEDKEDARNRGAEMGMIVDDVEPESGATPAAESVQQPLEAFLGCPLCKSPMQPGRASVEQSTGGAILDLLGALSHGGGGVMPHYIYFRSTDGGDAVDIKPSGPAYYCPRCEALLITRKLSAS